MGAAERVAGEFGKESPASLDICATVGKIGVVVSGDTTETTET